MHDEGVDLGGWLDLVEEVARRHRQGQVLGTDPNLVLRGLPPMWRPAARSGGPADDVVALAGAALDRVRPGDAELRAPLVEAAAGCLGSDLPSLLRRLRPLVLDRLDGSDEVGDDEPGGRGRPAGSGTGDPRALRRRGRRVAARPPRPGRRLAAAGAVGAVALALLGGITGWPASAPTTVALTTRPTRVAGDRPASVAWQPPHLLVEVGGTRYRYRLAGPVDQVALADGHGPAAVVVTSGRERWELAVPALDATGPGPAGSG